MKPADMTNLKPCPFCGSGPAQKEGRYTQASFSGVEIMRDVNGPYVWCGSCCNSAKTCASVGEAITAWNTRATPVVKQSLTADVTEADREAAANYLAALVPTFPLLAERARENGTMLSRILAAHRIAAYEAGRVAGLEEAAKIASRNVPSTAIEYEIRALKEKNDG